MTEPNLELASTFSTLVASIRAGRLGVDQAALHLAGEIVQKGLVPQFCKTRAELVTNCKRDISYALEGTSTGVHNPYVADGDEVEMASAEDELMVSMLLESNDTRRVAGSYSRYDEDSFGMTAAERIALRGN